MILSLASQLPFRHRLDAAGMADRVYEHGLQIEAAIEAIGECAEILGELEGLVAAAGHGLEVAEVRVDPGELGQIAGLAIADYEYVCAHPASMTPEKQSRPSL